jgi:dTDP-4-amino-4,6-dideoxygalactose transaminase
MNEIQVPFFRPDIAELEINEVVNTLRSGWLTSGKRVQLFEGNFAAAVGAPHTVGLNSCTAALHLAVEALGLKAGQRVLVPTMTFAATAEVVRYLGGVPVLVDCDPVTGNMDLADARNKIESSKEKGEKEEIVGIMPVHVGGMMMDLKVLSEFAAAHKLWVVEDAAHAFPAAYRSTESEPWLKCGQMENGERRVVCFSFYANKTITTGEGGMAVTGNAELAQRMRIMSLHGLSQDAWERYSGGSSWDYRIIAPGFKYNLTDIAAAIGIHQLERAEEMRRNREGIAQFYREALADVAEIELPPESLNRIHAWHLFPIRLVLKRLVINRDQFLDALKGAGVGCSVHWRPLHLHPYYQESFGLKPEEFPMATGLWQRLISLPIFPSMQSEEREYVVGTVKAICAKYATCRRELSLPIQHLSDSTAN